MPTTDHKRDERLQIIHKCLKTKSGNWSVKKLLEKVNQYLENNYGKPISARTIAADLKYLEEKKFAPVIPVKNGKEIYYTYEEDFELNQPIITKDQFISLVIAQEILQQLKGFPLTRELEKLSEKLEQQLNDDTQPPYAYINFETVTKQKNIHFLEELFDAIKNKTVLKIMYKHFKAEESTEKIIHPYFLKQFNQRWFLFGFDEINNRLDNSPIDRIERIKPSTIAFRENKNYLPEEYFRDMIGVTKYAESKREKISFWVSKNRADYVITKPFHTSQNEIRRNEIGDVQFEIEVIINKELISLILAFGKDLTIDKPKHLKEIIKNELAETLNKYSI